jgi:uncharacterized protein (TIGR02246 family)
MPTRNPNPAQSAKEESDVKAVVAELAENWNRYDITAFAALFAENADFVNVIGMHWHGRQEIETKHAQSHRTIFRNSVLRIAEVTVRFLNPNIALAHARTELKGAESLREPVAPEVRRSLLTCVLTRAADRWLIAAAHNTYIVQVVPES